MATKTSLNLQLWAREGEAKELLHFGNPVASEISGLVKEAG